ncbi:dipeptidase 1-like [Lytechinus variegatus]|uniref:dipeptidase 1-like n=1 Tax=Lytechinus variegatus TaxID=7654 RepID=UPI001BB27D0F|nr:dipeptidase 1-like [Lytechinus variegatus]
MERGRLILIIVGITILLVAIVVAIAVPVSLNNKSKRDSDLARQYMREVPLIDGHNDLPWQLVIYEDNDLSRIDLNQRPTFNVTHTDIPRLREGLVGAQFWAAYTYCTSQYKDAVVHAIAQIDVIKRMVQEYPEVFEFVTTAQGIRDAFENGKIASLIGVEGGHNIDNSFAVLRAFYDLGTRYMTITHSCNTPWADNWKEDFEPEDQHNGLSEFGKDVIREMNRLGMLVDLSHVSVDTMNDALDVTEAPVIFSHTSAYALCNHYRNAPDSVLRRVKENKGIVMVNFYTLYINCPPNNVTADPSYATLAQVADHMDHIKEVCGWECVGFGSDYDGIDTAPEGLEDASTFPALVTELIQRQWTEEEIKGALGNNFLRVFEEAEQVSRDLKANGMKPKVATLPRDEPDEANNVCRTYMYGTSFY